MDELVRWRGQQLDKDERTARATEWDGSGNKLAWELMASATIDVGGDEFYVGDRTIANHMMAWDPARVLREIDAKRQLLADVLSEPHFMSADDHWNTCPAVVDEDGVPVCLDESRAPGPCDCGREARVARRLHLLALPYADRPGYRDDWRP